MYTSTFTSSLLVRKLDRQISRLGTETGFISFIRPIFVKPPRSAKGLRLGYT